MKKARYRFSFLLLPLFTLWSCTNNKKGVTHEVEDSTTLRESNSEIFTYEGGWYWRNFDSTNTFKIILKQKGDSLFGQYCAVAYSGNRLDCDIDTIYNIYGSILKDSASVFFNSFFGAEGGKATLKIKADSLVWRIVIWPQGADCFAPSLATLTRNKLW